MAPNTGALVNAIRTGTVDAAGEYFHNVSANGKTQNPLSAGWTGLKGKKYPEPPMNAFSRLVGARGGENSPDSHEAGAREDTVPFVNPLDKNKK